MAYFRVGRCPACRSNKVTVIGLNSLKMLAGLVFTLGAAAMTYVLGLLLKTSPDNSPSMQTFAECVRLLNRWIMFPLAVLVVVFYFMVGRVGSKKRICRECGKKWKVRSHGEDGEERAPAASKPAG